MRQFAQDRLHERRVTDLDVLAGIHEPYLRRLCEKGFALEGSTIRLAAAMYDLGRSLFLQTKGLRLLGDETKEVHMPMLRGEGEVLTRGVDAQNTVETWAEGVVIKQVSVHSSAETDRPVGVAGGSTTVTGCDLRGTVRLVVGAKLLLKDSVVLGCNQFAVTLGDVASIQSSTLQDNRGDGIMVTSGGEGAVCEGNNTSNQAGDGDFLSISGSTFIGVAEELIR